MTELDLEARERERIRFDLEKYKTEAEDMGITLQEYLLLRILDELKLW